MKNKKINFWIFFWTFGESGTGVEVTPEDWRGGGGGGGGERGGGGGGDIASPSRLGPVGKKKRP